MTSSPPPFHFNLDRLSYRVVWPVVLSVAAVLASSSLVQDSITFDEPSHLASGMAILQNGDYRFAPEHPPLAKLWCAWPLRFLSHRWPDHHSFGWREGVIWPVGIRWLFEMNPGEQLILPARLMMVLLLLTTLTTICWATHLLFGKPAAILALGVASLDPALLAHGRLVTTDLPIALTTLLTLALYSQLLQELTLARFIAASLSMAAMALIKFSWLLILPALAIMALVAIAQANHIKIGFSAPTQKIRAIRQKFLIVLAATFGTFAIIFLSIWTCYSWRFSPFAGPDAADAFMIVDPDPSKPPPASMAEVWDRTLHDTNQNSPPRGPLVKMAVWAKERRLLPEAYLYGLVYTLRSTQARTAYLMGEISSTGWLAYFPIALAIKTPLATLAMFLMGMVAVARNREFRSRNPILLVGLVVFGVLYSASCLTSQFNIGHRHLLPLYPVIIIFCGAAAHWFEKTRIQYVVPALATLLIYANLSIYPHYLSYFNELVGGAKNGHHYLVDSNLDWGQDLKRLASYTQTRPNETVKLSYFGSANPTCYGIKCHALPSFVKFSAPPAELSGGTYVISATMASGVYWATAQEQFWRNPNNLQEFQQLSAQLRQPLPPDASEQDKQQHALLEQKFYHLSFGRLVNNLRQRTPDARIGYSFFVYRLSRAEIETLLAVE